MTLFRGVNDTVVALDLITHARLLGRFEGNPDYITVHGQFFFNNQDFYLWIGKHPTWNKDESEEWNNTIIEKVREECFSKFLRAWSEAKIEVK